jgi:hypothetical protein
MLRILFVSSDDPPLLKERYYEEVSCKLMCRPPNHPAHLVSLINDKDLSSIDLYSREQSTDDIEDPTGRISVDKGIRKVDDCELRLSKPCWSLRLALRRSGFQE